MTAMGKKTAIRVGWLVSTVLLAVLVLGALIGVLNRPLWARPLAKTIYVDGVDGQDGDGCGTGVHNLACKTIQEALANHAQDGDTILVAAGSYTENLLVTRAITLQGGWDRDFGAWNPTSYTTVISGWPGLDTVIISNTTALLDGLTVFQGDDGVQVQGDAGARLIHLTVHGTGDEGIESNGLWLVVSNTEVFDTGDNGILVEQGRAEVYDSTVHDTGKQVTYNSRRGIYLRGSGPDVISHTVVYSAADDGIRIRDAGSGLLVNNAVYSSTTDGIQIDDVAAVLVKGNYVHAIGKDGIKFGGGGRAALRGNTVYDVADEGFQIEGSGTVTVEANTVYRAGTAGILAENSGGTALIWSNVVYSTTGLTEDGIHVNPGVVATVRGNTVYDVTDDAIDFKGTSGVVRDNRLYAVGDAGVQISGTTSISVAYNTIHDVIEAGIWVTNSGTALIAHNAVSRTVTGTAAIYVGYGVAATIEHNTVYSTAADGINFRGTTGQIRYNWIHQVGDQGINIGASDATIVGNTVYDTWEEGLRVRGGSRVLIQDNTIYNVLGDKEDGIHVEPGVTAEIVANRVYGAADDGVAFNGTVGTISGNDLHDNGASGIDVNADEVTISANRIFNNSLAGIELERADHFTVTNNLIGENRTDGVLVLGASTGRLINNTLVGAPVSGSLSLVGAGLHVLTDTATLTSINNIIVSHTTGISVAAGAWMTTTYDDVWGNETDYSGVVAGPGSIQRDPSLVDAAGRDYHLRFASPCVDAGQASLAPASDFEGDPRTGVVDIGADELLALSLTKLAPAFAIPGEPITYTIVVTNHLDITLTNLIITDVIPANANPLAVRDGTLKVGYAWWMVDHIPPDDGAAQVSFVVTATKTITNDRYRVVTSTQGVNSSLGPGVTTIVAWRLYLPVVLKDRGQ